MSIKIIDSQISNKLEFLNKNVGYRLIMISQSWNINTRALYLFPSHIKFVFKRNTLWLELIFIWPLVCPIFVVVYFGWCHFIPHFWYWIFSRKPWWEKRVHRFSSFPLVSYFNIKKFGARIYLLYLSFFARSYFVY